MLQYHVCLEPVSRLSHSVTVLRHCGDSTKNRDPGTMPAEKEPEKRLLIQVQRRLLPYSCIKAKEDPNYTVAAAFQVISSTTVRPIFASALMLTPRPLSLLLLHLSSISSLFHRLAVVYSGKSTRLSFFVAYAFVLTTRNHHRTWSGPFVLKPLPDELISVGLSFHNSSVCGMRYLISECLHSFWILLVSPTRYDQPVDPPTNRRLLIDH